MLTSTPMQRYIAANFLTASYRIIGKVQVSNSGLLGLLNNPNTAFLELKDAQMARINEPRKLAERVMGVRLIKYGLVAVGVARPEDMGPESVVHGGFGGVTRYPVRAITSIFELEGILEVTGRFDFAAILSRGTGDFLALYNATLRAIQNPDLRMESPAIVFNRRKVDIINILAGGEG